MYCSRYVYRHPTWAIAGIRGLNWAVEGTEVHQDSIAATRQARAVHQAVLWDKAGDDEGIWDTRTDLRKDSLTDGHRGGGRTVKVRLRSRSLMEGGRGGPSIDASASREPPDMVIMNMCAWAQNHTGKRELMR